MLGCLFATCLVAATAGVHPRSDPLVTVRDTLAKNAVHIHAVRNADATADCLNQSVDGIQ